MSRLFVLLLASLPFFSIRNPAIPLSLPLLILLVIAGVFLLKSLVTLKMQVSVSLLDVCVLAYLALIVVNLAFVPNAEGAKVALGKTLIYVGVYFCFKQALGELSTAEIAKAARQGAIVGTCLFVLVSFICVLLAGKLAILFSGFSYHTTTWTIFRSMDQILGSGSADSYEGRDIMRNAIAESFTLFFLVTLVFRYQNPAKSLCLQLLNVLLIIATFSRRAFYAIAIIIAAGSIKDTRGIKRGIYLLFVVGGVVAFTSLFQQEASSNRLADVSDGGRLEQYSDGVALFSNHPRLGTGFGSKLERGSYIHNFVIGSAAMMGVTGLLLALTMYTSVVAQLVRSLLRPGNFNAGVFLVIPVLSMSVGATFEGIFTITGWIGIALFSVCEENQLHDEINQESRGGQFAVVESDISQMAYKEPSRIGLGPSSELMA